MYPVHRQGTASRARPGFFAALRRLGMTPLDATMPPMLAFLFFLVTASAFPSTSSTSWMRPDAFHLAIGMPRAEALKVLADGGFEARKGDDERHTVVDYTPTQSLTLEFRKERLHSIRFELYTPIGQIAGAFAEEKKYLRDTLGAPRPVKSPSMLIYDSTLPNVMAVATKDSRKGLGTLVVRYYDPAGTK